MSGRISSLSKKCEFKWKKMEKYDRGRYIILQGVMKREDDTLMNVYSLNEKSSGLFKRNV